MDTQTTDSAVQSLRLLVSTIVRNTKNETAGRGPAPRSEARRVKPVLHAMLGRVPTAEEVETVLAV